MAEYWNGRNADGSLSGVTLVRGEPIPAGQYHLVCEVLVQHTDGDYLLMRRDPQKEAYPGWYEATAGGSALCGEDADECIRRELREETGITDGAFTKVAVCTTEDTIYHTYLCVTDADKSAVTLQQGETDEYRWVRETEFLAFLRTASIPTQKQRFMPYFRQRGWDV